MRVRLHFQGPPTEGNAIYTALPADSKDTAGRVATLLLGWHAMGHEQAHFLVAHDDADDRVWVVVSTQQVPAVPSGGFIYPEDVHPQGDADVCDKIARLYGRIPVGGRFSTRLRRQPGLPQVPTVV
jgi:hypothetical protein